MVSVLQEPGAVVRLRQICGGNKIVPILARSGPTYINPSIELIQEVVPNQPDNPF